MNRGLSLYLDVVRVTAALVVVVTHLAYAELSGGMLAPWRLVGNDAVMVFFVLSGFVIAYVSDEKEHTLRDYSISRLARLWSVAVPALILTILLDQLGRAINPAAYGFWWYAADDPVHRIVTALTFTNEIWFSSVRPFSNGPYWSLGYEFWYYAIFAALAYFGGWKRFAIVALLALVAGPKILLLAPIWFLGVWTYRRTKNGAVGVRTGLGLFFGSFAAYTLFRGSGLPVTLLADTESRLGVGFVNEGLHFSNEFVSSFIIGPLVAAHFLGAHAISGQLGAVLDRYKGAVRWAAQSTFTIYLLHYPLLRFIGALDYDQHSPANVALVFLVVAGTCFAVGPLIERTKDGWRKGLDAILIGRDRNAPAATLSPASGVAKSAATHP
jgi:peptidoglycan/LPS O-acetylase OafA/YrhL